MSDANEEPPGVDAVATPAAALWTGRILSGLVGIVFVASALGKLNGGVSLEEGFAHLGLPLDIRLPLAFLELVIAVIYLVPQTAVLGAILLTGYIGGAICTHWRVGDIFIVQIVIGVLVWLGVFLRDRRLWALLPIRR
ncbi:DoxX family protein [Bremerella sp. T1]|uniref:DoxX family protein n=1 Tax=Bremerella sp. TYQ1 TaxID=3119568 RepID=UPI001CCB9470|nr:DoxX family protein [Bremerella volcania]UBM35598.1 DoxX family protein [Bremerella volcania]